MEWTHVGEGTCGHDNEEYVRLKNIAFWDVPPCTLVAVYRRFGGMH
jgi:hypothetical protein